MEPENDRLSSTESEPQINSINPKERILARRLRIQRRIEAARKRLHPSDDEEDTILSEEKSLLEKQVEESTISLLVLLDEGRELVTNVQVAGESYEVKRRNDEASAKEIRLQKLEEEAALAVDKFNEINSKWEEIATYNDPLDLHQETEIQKEKCMELIEQKDKLIGELKAELKAADIRFVKDQVKQSEDITLLVERIDSLVKIMKRTYRNELNLIEQAINTERKDLIESHNKRWEALYKERERDEVNNLEDRFLALNEHNELMNTIMVEHQEKFRATKISLEKDIQVLQQQLEQMKAVCLLNKEKMEYNYQVLKKRDEESLLIRSQQKRRINKLQDSVTTLRRRIQTVEQATLAEEKRLRSEVVKLHHNIKDIKLKAQHFATVNNSKYNQLWKFNHDSAKKLLDKILNIDRIIYEQHLGFPWNPPSLRLMTKTDMDSYQAALEKIQSSKKDNTFCEEMDKDQRISIINNRLMQHILKTIANSAGFLVEAKLLQLLKDYNEEEETLVCLDNVFCGLGLKCEEDVNHLRKELEPYIECKTCEFDKHFIPRNLPRASCYTRDTRRVVINDEDTTEIVFDEEDGSQIEIPLSSDARKLLSKEKTSSVGSPSVGSSLTMTVCSDHMSTYGFSQIINDSFTKEESHKSLAAVSHENLVQCETTIPKVVFCKNPDHLHYIEPSNVLQTLKKFVENFTQCKKSDSCTQSIKDQEIPDTVSRLLKNNDVKLYWERFREIFSPEKEKLWDCLMIGLPKYHSILQERHKINKEVEQLKIQNSELRSLLQRYALPNNMKVSCLKPTRELLPPLTVKSSQESYKTPINLFLQLTENKKITF